MSQHTEKNSLSEKLRAAVERVAREESGAVHVEVLHMAQDKPDSFRDDVAEAAFIGNDVRQFLCRFGWHVWGQWSPPKEDGFHFRQKKICAHCRVVALRSVKIY